MLFTEKLLENAKAAIDEARQHADEITKLQQRVQELEHIVDEMSHRKAEEAAKRQQVEEEVQRLKTENATLADLLNKERARATSVQHEADRLRQKLVGPKTDGVSKTDETHATPYAQERLTKLESEVEKLRRGLDNLWKIESRREEKPSDDDEEQPVRRWGTWRVLGWLSAAGLAGWVTATYFGFLK
jgi:chromosome segregation ATPase